MKRTKQIAGGLFIILSLFVSSVSACICSHHAEKAVTENVSCHDHAESKPDSGTVEKNVEFNRSDECGCSAPAPRAVSKSETAKIEKQAASAPLAALELKATAIIADAKRFYFEKPFYLSDSFYNLKSPRAPPVA